MEDHPQDPLHVLKQLAREYEQKFKQLEEISQNTQPDSLLQRLSVQAELTTDRFRALQLPLLAMLVPANPGSEGEKAYMTAISLCRCFDEMRILAQILIQHFPISDEQEFKTKN